jgi:hypothetical protein
MEVDKAREIALQDVTVDVKPIIRKRAFFKEGHDGEFMFTGCVKTYQLPYDIRTSSYVRIFKNSEEQEAFEILLDRPKGSLNIYDRHNEFWTKYRIEIDKAGKTLDLSVPSHALEHKVLQANTVRIALDWESRNKPGYEFALVNETQVQEDAYKATERQEDAMNLFTKISKSNSKMYNLLRIMGKTYDKNMMDNTKHLKTELMAIMNNKVKDRSNNAPNIDDFIKAAKDPDFEMKVFVFDMIDKGEITVRGNTFKVVSTSDIIGSNIDQAVQWLSALQNQEVKLLLQQKIKVAK